jgi:hypothetical protein
MILCLHLPGPDDEGAGSEKIAIEDRRAFQESMERGRAQARPTDAIGDVAGGSGADLTGHAAPPSGRRKRKNAAPELAAAPDGAEEGFLGTSSGA